MGKPQLHIFDAFAWQYLSSVEPSLQFVMIAKGALLIFSFTCLLTAHTLHLHRLNSVQSFLILTNLNKCIYLCWDRETGTDAWLTAAAIKCLLTQKTKCRVIFKARANQSRKTTNQRQLKNFEQLCCLEEIHSSQSCLYVRVENSAVCKCNISS